MANYQFVHYETYGLATRTKRSTARGVIAEAERVPTHSKHVAQPKAPKLLHGCMPAVLLAEIEAAATTAKDRSGKKKLPKDAQILLAGVVSMPLTAADLLEAHTAYVKSGKKDKPEALRQYDKWRKLTLAWLKDTYGSALRSVVLHYDEPHVHLHYYCARQVTNGTLNLDGLDVAGDAERKLGQGRKARNANGGARKKVRAQALSAFQDAYSVAVGLPMGWARLGPQKRRLTRAEWKVDEDNRRKLADALEKAQMLEARLVASREINNDLKKWSGSQVAALEASLQALQSSGEDATPHQIDALKLRVTSLRRRLTI